MNSKILKSKRPLGLIPDVSLGQYVLDRLAASSLDESLVNIKYRILNFD
jgi:hypothetical protein